MFIRRDFDIILNVTSTSHYTVMKAAEASVTPISEPMR